jgi:hypothetical protein
MGEAAVGKKIEEMRLISGSLIWFLLTETVGQLYSCGMRCRKEKGQKIHEMPDGLRSVNSKLYCRHFADKLFSMG